MKNPLPVHLLNSKTDDRERLEFCVSGFSTRDELLLKSAVRLLHSGTRHCWVYAPTGQDLAILGIDKPAIAAMANGFFPRVENGARANLAVGLGREGFQFWVSMPLYLKDLEAALNSVGDWLLAQAQPLAADENDAAQFQDGEKMQLMRWPLASFLTTPERRKAATILLKKPTDLRSLARKSGMELGDCATFVAGLPHVKRMASAPSAQDLAKLSEHTEAHAALRGHARSGHQAGSRRIGILTRIRSRLGLK